MGFPTLTIETGPRRRSPSKTTGFSTHLLGYLTAEALWDPGGDDSAERPVWLAYFGTEQETQPFTANLRAGKKARFADRALQIPRQSRYRWEVQRVPRGVVTVVYLQHLFHLEPPPGPLPEEARFIFAPPSWWIAEQADSLAPDFGADASDAARAALFCAFLDRRTPLPLVHDLRFHLQVYRAALETEWIEAAGEARGSFLRGFGVEASGLDTPLACFVSQATLAGFLTHQTSLFHEENRHGATAVQADRRLLRYSASSAS